MPNTEIGEGAVVASMSYVDTDIPDWTVRYPDGSTVKRDKFEKYE
jgi:galactoside O-acetyltransferase